MPETLLKDAVGISEADSRPEDEFARLVDDEAVKVLREQTPNSPEFSAWMERQKKEMAGMNQDEASARLDAKIALAFYRAGYYGGGLDRMKAVKHAASKIGGTFGREVTRLTGEMEKGNSL